MSGITNPTFDADAEDDAASYQTHNTENGEHAGSTLHRRKQSAKSDSFPVPFHFEPGTEHGEVKGESPQYNPEDGEFKGDLVSRALERFWKVIGKFTKKHKTKIQYGVLLAVNIAYIVYLAFASVYWENNCKGEWQWCDGFGMLVILTSIVYFFLIYFLVIKKYYGKAIYDGVLIHIEKGWDEAWEKWVVLRGIVYLIPLAALAAFLVIDTAGSRERLISFGGVVALILLGFIFSKYPGQVKWRPVFWGLLLQFSFGLLTIRWTVGREVFRCVGDKVALFLSYSYNGSSFVYGDDLVYVQNLFAFQVLPVIFFFSFMLHILFYLGSIQWFVMKLGWLLQISMGTTVCESVNAAASIFLGMSESPLLIKPFIKLLTHSEMHAIMTEGFATVAGTVLAAYISFGVSPAHLVTASVMSAPAALCYSKLFYPETEESKTKVNNIVMEERTETSILDAATKGALAGTELVMGIIANIIAFVAFVAFMNALLSWFGGLVGWSFLDFQWLLAKIFIPLSYLMGVEAKDCENVGMLIGLKTVINEFVAYKELGKLSADCILSPRSEAIATYALCGFANPSSIGILVGALATMAPEQRPKIASVAFRAFIAGSATCFLTACIAGILLTEENYIDPGTSRNCTYNATFGMLQHSLTELPLTF